MLPRKETKQSPSVWFKSAADAEYDIAQYNTTLYYRVHCSSTDITDIHEAMKPIHAPSTGIKSLPIKGMLMYNTRSRNIARSSGKTIIPPPRGTTKPQSGILYVHNIS